MHQNYSDKKIVSLVYKPFICVAFIFLSIGSELRHIILHLNIRKSIAGETLWWKCFVDPQLQQCVWNSCLLLASAKLKPRKHCT